MTGPHAHLCRASLRTTPVESSISRILAVSGRENALAPNLAFVHVRKRAQKSRDRGYDTLPTLHAAELDFTADM